MSVVFRLVFAVLLFVPAMALVGCGNSAPSVIEEPEEGAFEALADEAAAEEEAAAEQ